MPLVFANCRISTWMHLKYHIPVSSFTRDSLHPSSPTRTFLFPDSSGPLSSCLSHTFLCPVYPGRTLSRSGVKTRDLRRCGGANEEDRLEAASATSHQIGGIKRRNPFADSRWWEPIGIKGAGEAAARLRADGGGSCSERGSVGRARNVSGSRRGSDRPHARYRWIARSRPSSGHYKRCGA